MSPVFRSTVHFASPLRHDYLIDELIGEIAPHGVVKSVYIQINVASQAEVAEVAWVQSVADAHGFPHGIVGYVDLAAPDVDVDVFRRQIAQIGAKHPPITLFVSQDDAALAASSRLAGEIKRVGAVDPLAEPYASDFKAEGLDVVADP